jgi:molybdopterin converting factor small subunit
MRRIIVEYKLWLRDKVGVDREEYILDKPYLSKLIELIISKHPELRKYLENAFSVDNPLIVIVDGYPVNHDKKLGDGSVVKFLPPVSGG